MGLTEHQSQIATPKRLENVMIQTPGVAEVTPHESEETTTTTEQDDDIIEI